MAGVAPSQDQSVFFHIPLEIRQQIYGYCIPQKPEPRGWVESEMMLNFLARKDQGQPVTREAASVHTLIDRPGEPTIHITDYCMRCNNYYEDVPASRRSALPGLLLICRQINVEVETMLYGNNTFIVDIPHDYPCESESTPYNRNTGTVEIRHLYHPKGQGAIERLGPRRRAKIRKLILNVRPEWACCRLDIDLERNIWDSVLGNLKVIALVMDKPGLPNLYVFDDQQDPYKDSKARLTSMFKYFRDAVPETTDIVGYVERM
ncbi:hypothetical protein GE09DRAFT_1213114 [Coniochaeta sp. 2T2.1]|nr:hypothetical protein GE09DRAFT_1213114 [Coniochaeta sp. 2T2.1]